MNSKVPNSSRSKIVFFVKPFQPHNRETIFDSGYRPGEGCLVLSQLDTTKQRLASSSTPSVHAPVVRDRRLKHSPALDIVTPKLPIHSTNISNQIQ